MPHPAASEPPKASLELTPVGGRLSLTAVLSERERSEEAFKFKGLTEELDKLSFSAAHPAGVDAAAQPATAPRDQWSFRVKQQVLVDGQHALRLSIWRASSFSSVGVTCLAQNAEKRGTDSSLHADARQQVKTEKNALKPKPDFVCNFYFRLPFALPSLRLLGASQTVKQQTAGEKAAGRDEDGPQRRVTEIRVSLQCSVRPGSLSEALQEIEERRLRALSAFRVTCKRCGECLARLGKARLLLLPSAVWREAHDALACEECSSTPLIAGELYAKPNRVCVAAESIHLAPSDTSGLLKGPWIASAERVFACSCLCAVSCGSCGLSLGRERESKPYSLCASPSSSSGAASLQQASADTGTKDAGSRARCLEEQEAATGRAEGQQEPLLSAGQLPAEASKGPSTVLREVVLLKRRVQLQPLEAEARGVNLVARHSDLAAFTEELSRYSRAAAALRFLVLPFAPPRGAESPWEIGWQAPPACSGSSSTRSFSLPNYERNSDVPAQAWVALDKNSAALELRILLREFFVAMSGTREAGPQGHLAMKVLLREVYGQEDASPRKLVGAFPSVKERRRVHMARLSWSLFSELLRLRREAEDESRGGQMLSSPTADEQPSDPGSTSWKKATVVLLPTL
ncbi:hypothetical protein Efla_005238 [Eimeria flavescens]